MTISNKMTAGAICLLQTKNKEIGTNKKALVQLSSILQYQDTNTDTNVFHFFFFF